MSPAVTSSVAIVATLALFAAVGIVFLFANLLIGRFVRPADPHQEKLEIYECGEPTIGSSFVQFDLRFYVVALLFIIFDVEVAFFFPWATVFGKAINLSTVDQSQIVAVDDSGVALTPAATALYQEMGVREPSVPQAVPASLSDQIEGSAPAAIAGEVITAGSRQLALLTIVDIAVFFAVLLVGFAYVWKRGDLDWVRAVTIEKSQQRARPPSGTTNSTQQSVLTA